VAKGEGHPPAEPQAPILPRCWCDDTTVEALAISASLAFSFTEPKMDS
jgi:hypothetical protein